jgi:methionine synthase II (cobalamin-independent)
MTLPSPSMVHFRSGIDAVDRTVYPDLEQFWTDLSAAYADEIRALAAAGCSYLQLDDTSLACLNGSGGFAPLRFVPQGKHVVLGLVTTKRGRLEDPDMFKRRIEEAAQYVPLGPAQPLPAVRVLLSTVEGNVLNPYQEVDKLRLVVKVAQDVWGSA